MKFIFFLSFITAVIYSCESIADAGNNSTSKNSDEVSSAQGSKIPYNFSRPDRSFELPSILNEISGITDIDSIHIACVQDEIGTVFIYNILSGTLEYSHRFDDMGDFEGLTFTGTSLFILRSDGRLTEWKNFTLQKGGDSLVHIMLLLPTDNNEGICYDAKQERLLISAKSKPKNRDAKFDRYIYAYDLQRKQVQAEPLIVLNTSDLETALEESNIFNRSYTPRGKLRHLNFRASSLAIHPLSGELYILSAAEHMLLLLNPEGKIIGIESLDPVLFPKAEGITFLNDGTMIISNEAAGNVPTMKVFKMN